MTSNFTLSLEVMFTVPDVVVSGEFSDVVGLFSNVVVPGLLLDVHGLLPDVVGLFSDAVIPGLIPDVAGLFSDVVVLGLLPDVHGLLPDVEASGLPSSTHSDFSSSWSSSVIVWSTLLFFFMAFLRLRLFVLLPGVFSRLYLLGDDLCELVDGWVSDVSLSFPGLFTLKTIIMLLLHVN